MWRTRDWTCTGIAAASAFGLTLGLFRPTPATAVDPAIPAPVIDTPKLKVNDFVITAHWVKSDQVTELTANAATIKPGPVPKFQLEAVNNGSLTATVSFTGSLKVSTIRDMLSRVPMPRSSKPEWSEEYTLTLKPGETRELEVATNTLTASLSTAALSLQSGNEKITALTLAAVSPATPSTKPSAAIASLKQLQPAQ